MFLIWKNLGGESKGHITLNNLRIFLLAISGAFVDPGLNRDEQVLQKIDNNEFGFFNDFGDLFLDFDDIPKIQKLFQSLYINRL